MIAGIVQLVEQRAHISYVDGSIPSSGKMKLYEVFENYYKAPHYASHLKEYPVHKNPASKEIKEVMDESDIEAIRFIADPSKEIIYIFPVDILHTDVAKNLYDNPEFLLFGVASKHDNKLEAEFGQAYGSEVEQDNYYENILKKEWNWLDKYMDIAPMFTTVMRRYRGK